MLILPGVSAEGLIFIYQRMVTLQFPFARLLANEQVTFVAPENGFILWVPLKHALPGYEELMQSVLKFSERYESIEDISD